MKRILFPILLCFITACARNPVTGKSELSLVSQDQEIALGQSHYKALQQAQGGPYVTHSAVQKYVTEIGQKLAHVSDRPDLPYEFVVLNNPIPNAWSLPGGKIGINRGLLTELQNEAELAAVLAHEIVHSAARHSAKAYERGLLWTLGLIGLEQIVHNQPYERIIMGTADTGAQLIGLKHSRTAEFEADHFGIKYMVAAGYDPKAAVELQKTFVRLSKGKRSNWFSNLFETHPPSQERVEANERIASSYPSGGKWGKSEYEKIIKALQKDQSAYDNLDFGYAAFERKNFGKALNFAEKGIQIQPHEAHLYNLKGKAEVQLGLLTDALKSFNHAIELNPNYFDFYLQRGKLKKLLGDYSGSKKDLDISESLIK